MKNWKSLEELFVALNNNCNYVVLRNFEDFYNQEHLDIDFLTDDRKKLIETCDSTSRTNDKFDYIHQSIKVGDKYISIDVRCVGDGYYDKNWELSILKNKEFEKFYYRPNTNDYLYSLMYHVLVHKKQVSCDYIDRLKSIDNKIDTDSIDKMLNNYMKENNYYYTYPEIEYTVFNLTKADKDLIEKNIIKKYKRTAYILKNVIKEKYGRKNKRSTSN